MSENKALAILKSDRLVQKFADVAPSYIKYEAEQGFALQQLMANDFTRKIAESNPQSLLFAMSNVAACGLSLNPASKEAYLVPRKGSVCFDPSYMGLCKLLTDTGSIKWIQAKLVYANDNFVMNGVDEKPTHNTQPFGDRGEIVGVYSTALTSSGSYLTEAMSISDVHAIRNRSEAYKKNPERTPWFTDEGEMIKKTCVKRQFKMLPKSSNHSAEDRLANAVQVSHDNEEVTLVTSSPDLGQYSDEQKAYFDQLMVSSDELEMYVLQQTTSEREFTNLYHSFEKGTKGKYQQVVDGLTREGQKEFEHQLIQFQDGFDLSDEGMSQSCLDLIKERAQ